MRTRIKICGVRDLPGALAAAEAGADAVGFVFVPASIRNITPADALEIALVLPPMITKVALLVDPAPDDAARLAAEFPLDAIQLHGSEDERAVADVREAVGCPVYKAVRYDPDSIGDELRRWEAVPEVDAILVDGSAGGQGTAFDWAGLARAAAGVEAPIVLAGGLTPDNVADAIAAAHPFAVDVSSGVEKPRGVKDPALIARFARAVHRADAADD